MTNDPPLLEIENLSVTFPREEGIVRAVDDISFSIPRGRTVGLVGESGCGKSATGLSLLKLIQAPGRIASGRILLYAESARSKSTPVDIAALPERGEAVRAIRGAQIAMIFQEPMTSLNPVYTIGAQITEMIRAHEKAGAQAAKGRAIEMLRRVGIPDPELRVNAHPGELSGGMRQRAMIAIALACRPRLLVADEPTTALDVTVQAQILDLLRELQQETGMSMLLISHDLGVIADLADSVVVMYAGKIVENGSVDEVFYSPQHPYTRGLLQAAPVLGQPARSRLYSIPGSVPNPLAMPAGCSFRPRCPERFEKCTDSPRLLAVTPDHMARCWARERNRDA